MIEIISRQRKRAIPKKVLQSFANEALCEVTALSGTALPEEITVIFVSDKRIAQLHMQFMGIQGPTDVITFQHGEIFISVETAECQAHEIGVAFEQELKLYLIHGLLHLAGYDDLTESGFKEMSRLQIGLLKKLTN
jgi:probable rRNA maturation factor